MSTLQLCTLYNLRTSLTKLDHSHGCQRRETTVKASGRFFQFNLLVSYIRGTRSSLDKDVETLQSTKQLPDMVDTSGHKVAQLSAKRANETLGQSELDQLIDFILDSGVQTGLSTPMKLLKDHVRKFYEAEV